MGDKLDINNIIKRLKEGKLDISLQLDSFLGNSNLAALIRRLFLEKELNLSLSSIASTILDFEEITGKNVENAIGAVQIPLAVVGPLLIKGNYAYGKFYIPLATTQKDLIYETHRGCKVLTLSGGVNVKVFMYNFSGAILLIISKADLVAKFVDKLNNMIELIRNGANRLFGEEKLKKIEVYRIENLILLKTIYSHKDLKKETVEELDKEVCKIIKIYFGGIRCLIPSKERYFNSLIDLGDAFRNGYVVAEALIKKDIIEKVLGVSPKDIHNANTLRNLIKEAVVENTNLTIDFIDVIVSIYTAIGLDVALALRYYPRYLWANIMEDESLHIGVVLPVLSKSTISNVALLPPQMEAGSILNIMVESKDQININMPKFVEILASTVLARALGLLSTLAQLMRQ